MVLADKDWLIPTKPKLSLWREKEGKEEKKKKKKEKKEQEKGCDVHQMEMTKTSELVLHLAAG